MSRASAMCDAAFARLARATGRVGDEELSLAIEAVRADPGNDSTLGDPLESSGALDPESRQALVTLVDRELERDARDRAATFAPIDPRATVVGAATDPYADSSGRAHETPAASGTFTAPAPPRYRPIELHARGGLGEVYRAEDLELHREVALKEIRDRHADDANSRAPFLTEAEVTGGGLPRRRRDRSRRLGLRPGPLGPRRRRDGPRLGRIRRRVEAGPRLASPRPGRTPPPRGPHRRGQARARRIAPNHGRAAGLDHAPPGRDRRPACRRPRSRRDIPRSGPHLDRGRWRQTRRLGLVRPRPLPRPPRRTRPGPPP